MIWLQSRQGKRPSNWRVSLGWAGRPGFGTARSLTRSLALASPRLLDFDDLDTSACPRSAPARRRPRLSSGCPCVPGQGKPRGLGPPSVCAHLCRINSLQGFVSLSLSHPRELQGFQRLPCRRSTPGPPMAQGEGGPLALLVGIECGQLRSSWGTVLSGSGTQGQGRPLGSHSPASEQGQGLVSLVHPPTLLS